ERRERLAVAPNKIAERAQRPAEVALHIFAIALVRAHDAVGEPRERQRLHPDAARAGHRREEQACATEQRRLDAADELDGVADRRIEGDEAAGVDAQPFARLQLHRDDRAAAVDEDLPGPFQALQDEAFPAEKSGSKPFGELDVDVDLTGRAQERIALTEDCAA